MTARSAVLLVGLTGSPSCLPAPRELAAEGARCEGPTTCQDGLACVPDVGAEHGFAGSDDVCERPRAVYDFMHFGERGENRRIDQVLDMLSGTYVLPRMSESEPGLDVVAHQLVLADGHALDCRPFTPAQGRECLVPDWSRYHGDAIPKYSRFILFGARMTAPFIYVYQHAPDAQLSARLERRTGDAPSRRELGELRLAARDAALAVFDSFVSRGHRPFALAELPGCSPASAGYQNPNAAWAPELDGWDPTTRLDGGRLVTSANVPVDCAEPQGMTYLELRDSLWDRHATAYRALSLSSALQLFRGLLPEARRRAWVAALRDTADALALPSSYEAGNNHGLTQSVALMLLGHELSAAGGELVPRSLGAAWIDLGRHRLNDLVADTVFSDGVQVEQSPFYHNYQLGLTLYVARWLRQTGITLGAGIDPRYATATGEIPPEQRRDFDSREAAPTDRDINQLDPDPELDVELVVDSMARAASHLVQPDGWVPTIGSSLPQQFRGYAAPAFEPYLQGDSPAARELSYVWSGGQAGEAPPASQRLMVFPDSGFVTLRSSFSAPLERQTHVVFNAGMPQHRHSHADALAVHLYGRRPAPEDGGAALLIDPGWYSYRDDGRHYFESTAAHNTVTVDELNQCTRTPVGKRAAPHVDLPLEGCSERAARSEPGAASAAVVAPGRVSLGLSTSGATGGVGWLYQSAAHGLYEGVAHRRAVLLFGASVVLVLDRLTSDEPRDFAQRWHITPEAAHPGELVPRSGAYSVPFMSTSSASDTPLFSLHQAGSTALVALGHQGEPSRNGVPGLGWMSTAEGEMTSHPVVEFRRAAVTDAAFGSLFLLGELAAEPAQLALEERGPHGLRAIVDLPRARLSIDVENLARASGESVVLLFEGDVPGDAG